MSDQKLVITVLPLTIRPDAPFHVSVHIAPKLTPSARQEPLSNFAAFAEWANVISGATITLEDANGASIAAASLNQIDRALWAKCFPPDTPVRRPDYGDLATREWTSFPVKAVHDLSALAAVGSALWFPVDPPDLKILAQDRESPLRQIIKTLGILRQDRDKDGRRVFGDKQLTRQLDEGLEGDNALTAALTILHKARRFYEPAAGNVVNVDSIPAIAEPDPDFHERVAHYADQPELLRRLGLVIDLKVSDLARLKSATELSARIDPNSDVTVISARTPVVRQGSRLLTKPGGNDWTGGLLRLGDPKLYAALTMDSDGAAMKLGNFLRALPRMLAMADNGDPGNVAPPSLRSEGFTVVRTERMDATKGQVERATKMASDLDAGFAPVITTEDVNHGLRVEIWDDHERRWFSPHRRLATATLADGSTVYTDRLETGWAQTAAVRTAAQGTDPKAYLHEALFGWSGWSLSAPRPGPRAEPADATPEGQPLPPRGQREVVTDTPAAHDITPVAVTTKVAPGTLPRLRYGRSYAFRAWGVDLAGNSQGGDIPPETQPIAPIITGPRAPAALARDTRPFARELPFAMPIFERVARVTPQTATAPMRTLASIERPAVGAHNLAISGNFEVDTMVAARLNQRIAARRDVPTNDMLVNQMRAGFADIRLDVTSAVPPEIIAVPDLTAAVVKDTVTALAPFKRWDPVPPPVVVARHRYSPAESVHHLVIRSGVDEHGVVSDPAAYMASLSEEMKADWRATSERHLAAPKGSQHLNELHGRFDAGIDDPTLRPKMLAAALRDDGTLYDAEIVSLDDPNQTVTQPGVTLQAGPEVKDPKKDLTAYLGINRGEPIPAGHYVVHDAERLALPWLPDPLAAGVALGMSGANRGSPLIGLFRTESTTARYQGEWPAPAPFRLVLGNSDKEASASVKDGVIQIALPPGTRLDMRLSSSLRREDLELLALWGLIPEGLRKLDLVSRPAADGQFWAMTPYEPITLVHAVPRPVLAPVIAKLLPIRFPGSTHADLAGVIECHASSTDRIEAEAQWSETIDDLAATGPVKEDKHAVAFSVQVDPDEDMVVLGINEDANATEWSVPIPGMGNAVRIHRGRHEFGDTKARRIRYAFRGATRFREYFPPQLLSTPESQSRLGGEIELVIPNTVEPPVPEVDSVIPLFRWDEEGDPGQPFGFRRRRRSGLRIYLKRPWFRTGEDEQLAVLLALNPADATKSLWGGDPVWFNAGPEIPHVGLSMEDFYSGTFALDNERGNDPRLSPIAFPLSVPADNEGGKPSQASVIGYRPEYSEERRMWFVDIAIEPAAAVWPFVRLVVARYQPNSLLGLQLSKAVTCDFAQLVPERTLTVSRPDDGHVRMTVTGPIGLRNDNRGDGRIAGGLISTVGAGGAGGTAGTAASPYPFGNADVTNLVAKNRRMMATIEHRAAGETSDLDWKIVHEAELSIGGVDATGEWAWTGVLPIGAALGPATPAPGGAWRAMVCEVETIEGDPDVDGTPTRAARTIYADSVEL
jgi:hypothetical protein